MYSIIKNCCSFFKNKLNKSIKDFETFYSAYIFICLLHSINESYRAIKKEQLIHKLLLDP